MGDDIRVRGVMLLNKLDLLEELYGLTGAEVGPLLSPDLREASRRQALSPVDWYPIAWLNEVHGAAAELTGEGDRVARRLGAEGARRNFKTIHRAFLSVLSPLAVVARAPRILTTYFHGGRFVVDDSRAKGATVEFRDCFGFDRYTWEAVAGTAEALLELCQAKDIAVDFDFGDDASAGTLLVSWS